MKKGIAGLVNDWRKNDLLLPPIHTKTSPLILS